MAKRPLEPTLACNVIISPWRWVSSEWNRSSPLPREWCIGRVASVADAETPFVDISLSSLYERLDDEAASAEVLEDGGATQGV